jgi:hypothetical protein
LPGLIDLYEAHAAHRDQFEIIAFHDDTAKNFAELDEKLKRIKKAAWGGKDLPFPILLDETGETIKTFGVNKFPTTILIDPDGKLVGESDESVLELHFLRTPPMFFMSVCRSAVEKVALWSECCC